MIYFSCFEKDLLEALKTLSTFFTENSIRSRRNLRSDIEKRSLVLNEEFLGAFKNIKEVRKKIFQSKSLKNKFNFNKIILKAIGWNL